jgi:hypothetical protein
LYLCTAKNKLVQVSSQIFQPFKVEDTSSALYKHGRSMDEAPVLFSDKQDSSVIHQVPAHNYHVSGRFLSSTSAGNPVPKEKYEPPGVLVPLFVVPVLIALWMMKSNFQRIQGAFKAAFNNRYASIFMRNFTIGNQLSTYIFIVNAFFSLSVAVWLWLFQNKYFPLEQSTTTFLIIITVFAIYYLFRYLVIILTGKLFITPETTELYLFKDYFIQVIISCTLPFLLFAAAYSPLVSAVWYIAATILFLLLIYRIFLLIYTGISERTYGVLYFILYFCIVEIVPVVFLFKISVERISQ